MKITEKKVITGYPSIDKPWLKYYSEEAVNYSYYEMLVEACAAKECNVPISSDGYKLSKDG